MCCPFTTEGCRVFEIDSVREAVSQMYRSGVEIIRGICQNELYQEDKSSVNNKIEMFITHSKSESKYTAHLVTQASQVVTHTLTNTPLV